MYYRGYRVTEADLIKINQKAETLVFKRISKIEDEPRKLGFIEPVMFVDRGNNVGVRFHPDKDYYLNQMSACQHRFGCKMHEPDYVEFNRFMVFCEYHFRVFGKCSNLLSYEAWLEQTNYSKARKKQITLALHAGCKNIHVNKSFIKDEGYDSWKFPRGINSYDDYVKARLGPYVKSIEKHVYKQSFFVKGLTNAERDARLLHMFGGAPVCFTDFSHFESHHFGRMNRIFLNFVHYIMGPSEEFDMMEELITGVNVSQFRRITCSVEERLMSGAMWTSLQNSVINLFIISYLKFRADPDSFDFVNQLTMVEGDDGITSAFHWDKRVVRDLGIELKIDYAPSFSDASFCGRVLVSGVCFTEPFKALEKLMWFPTRYAGFPKALLLALLKYRLLSIAHNHRQCPLLYPVAYHMLCKLRNIDHRAAYKHVDQYMLEKFSTDFPEPAVRGDVRAAFESKYGVSIEAQILTERAAMNWQPGCSLPIQLDWPTEWVYNERDTRLV